MATKELITEAVFSIIDDVNEQLPQDSRITKSVETSLMGPTSVLDSMGIVFLIVATEKRLREEFGTDIKVIKNYSIFRENNPLRTVGTFIDYIYNRLMEVPV